MFRLFASLAVAAVVSLHMAQAAEIQPLVRIDGAAEQAELSGVEPAWRFIWKVAGEERVVPAEEIVSWGAFRDFAKGAQLLLSDGGAILADVLQSDGDRLTADSPLLGKLSIPLDRLSGAILHPPVDVQRGDRLRERLRMHRADADLLIFDNGDELTGTVLAIDLKTIELETKLGTTKIDISKIAALAFNPALAARPREGGERVLLGLRDGGRLTAEKLTLSSATKLQVALAGELVWTADLNDVVALQPLGFAKAVYLSDLKPSSYRHLPFLTIDWPYRADRNCLGTQLRSGGVVYPKGIGMHSAARLTYAVEEGHRRFAAELSIDSQTAGAGSVAFRVFADAKPLYASPVVRGDSPPLPLALVIPTGTKSLSLIVDFAERGDEQDHANWLNARLLP